MKKALIITASLFLLQSCYTYKSTTFNNMKVGKNYIIAHKNSGKKTEARYVSSFSDTILVKINGAVVKFPVNKIQSIKRKKISVLVLASGIAAGTVGIAILLNSYKGLPIPPQVQN